MLTYPMPEDKGFYLGKKEFGLFLSGNFFNMMQVYGPRCEAPEA